jgi:hypothetical protein
MLANATSTAWINQHERKGDKEKKMTDREQYTPGPPRGASTKGRRKVDSHSRQTTAPLAGKIWQSLTGASARVGALRSRWEPGGWNHGESHPGGNADALATTVTRADAPKLFEYNDFRWELEAFGGGTCLMLGHNSDRHFISWGAVG